MSVTYHIKCDRCGELTDTTAFSDMIESRNNNPSSLVTFVKVNSLSGLSRTWQGDMCNKCLASLITIIERFYADGIATMIEIVKRDEPPCNSSKDIVP